MNFDFSQNRFFDAEEELSACSRASAAHSLRIPSRGPYRAMMNTYGTKKKLGDGGASLKERKGKVLTDEQLRKYKEQEDVQFEDGTMNMLLDVTALEQDFTMCEALFHFVALFCCIWLGFGTQTQNMYHISRSTPEGLSFFGDFQHTVFDFEAINNMDKLEEWMGRVVLDHYRDKRPAFEDFNVMVEAEAEEIQQRATGKSAARKQGWFGCARTMRALNEYDSAIYQGVSISQQRGTVKRGVFVASQEGYGTNYLNNLTVGGIRGGGGDGLDGASAGAAAAQGGSSRRYVRHTWSPVHGLVRNGSMAGGTTFAGAYGGHNVVTGGPGPGGHEETDPTGHEGKADPLHAESHGSAPMNTEVWGRIHGTHHIYNQGHSKYDIPWRYAPRDRSLGPPKDSFSFHTTLSSWTIDDEILYDADGEVDEKAMSAAATVYGYDTSELGFRFPFGSGCV